MQEPEPTFRFTPDIILAARRRLSREVWEYVSGGSESEVTLRRNRQSLDRLALRQSVLHDLSHIDTAASLLGARLRIPVFLAPVGSISVAHREGGCGAALGAQRFGTVKFIGMHETPPFEEGVGHLGPLRVLQIYFYGGLDWAERVIEHAQKLGFSCLCLTVDTPVYSRFERNGLNGYVPPGDETNFYFPRGGHSVVIQADVTWKTVEAIVRRCPMPVILKGIQTAADAKLAIDCGAAAVYVSNHGGRVVDHAPGAIDLLPDIVAAVNRRAEILIDGGFVRGSDVVKALALGASAVGIGKLQVWALAAAGAAGVVRMLEILEEEIRATLAILGVPSLDKLSPDHLVKAEPVDFGGALSAFPALQPLELHPGAERHGCEPN